MNELNRIQKQISSVLRTSTYWFHPKEIESITDEAGAYILLLRLDKPVSINLPKQQTNQLAPGWYIYAGSARNKGGIRGRLRHHFSSNKKQHWHIDRLSINAARLLALPAPDGDECELLTTLLHCPGFDIVIDGFGSSDCSNCKSHLLIVSV